MIGRIVTVATFIAGRATSDPRRSTGFPQSLERLWVPLRVCSLCYPGAVQDPFGNQRIGANRELVGCAVRKSSPPLELGSVRLRYLTRHPFFSNFSYDQLKDHSFICSFRVHWDCSCNQFKTHPLKFDAWSHKVVPSHDLKLVKKSCYPFIFSSLAWSMCCPSHMKTNEHI